MPEKSAAEIQDLYPSQQGRATRSAASLAPDTKGNVSARVRSGGILMYPEDLGSGERRSWMRFSAIKTTTGGSGVTGATTKVNEKVNGFLDILLPMPPSIQIQQPVNWENQELGVLGGISLDLKPDDSFLGSAVEVLTQGYNQLKGEVVAPIVKGVSDALGSVTGLNVAGVIAKKVKAVRNPRLETIFKDISFRQFTFQFKMAPRSRKEAESVRAIVKAFRYHSAPDFKPSDNNKYFIFPSQFEIEFLRDASPHPDLPVIGRAVCTGVDVNYTSAGALYELENGHPVEIEMTLAFTEMEVVTKKRMEIEEPADYSARIFQ